VQTQVGLGVMPIEHAGEVPRRILPSNGVQGDPQREEDSGLFASGQWVRDAAPVVLPLPKGWIVAWTAISLALVPLAIWAMLALASTGPDDVPPDRASSRSDIVPPASRVEPAPAAPPVAQPPESSKAAPRAEGSPRIGAKQKVPQGKERRTEVQRRAAPKGRPSGDWVPRGP